MNLDRRAVLGGIAGLGGLLMAGGFKSVANAANPTEIKAASPAETKRFAQAGGDFSWKPQRLDLDEVANVAHAGYHHQGYG